MGFVKDAWNGITGKTSAKAAEKAGQLQADSSKYAADLAQKQFEQTRQDQMPWLNMGNAALQQLGVLTGLNPQSPSGSQVSPSAPPTTTQTGAAQGNIANTLSQALGSFGKGNAFSQFANQVAKNRIAQADGQPPSAVTAITMGADPEQPVAATSQASGGMPQYDDKWGGRIEDAYQSGQLTGGLDPSNFQTDPSYQFRKQQGMDGLQSSAAATGGLLSGAALKSLNAFNSDLASQEYGNAWQRDQAQKQNLLSVLGNNRSQDYGLWSGERARQYNELANLAGVGQQTATNLGQFGANNAQMQGNALINGANAQANGLIGANNARQQGLGNLLGLGAKALGMFI